MTTRGQRPDFARDWPEDEGLTAALDAFERGDFGAVRRAAKELAGHEDEAVRGAARDLVTRTAPDPLTGLLVGIAAALLAVLFGYWLAHDRRPAPTAPAGSVRIEGVERVQ